MQDQEKIKILIGKTIENKSKKELLCEYPNLRWEQIKNEKERRKFHNHSVFIERVKKMFNNKKKESSFAYYSKKAKGLLNFYNDLNEIYKLQTASNLKNGWKSLENKIETKLNWLKIEDNSNCCCFYCGISESILGQLYKNTNFRTERKRGAWFELDRVNAKGKENIYTKENIVLCCYYCNNHKSDVISAEEMRKYFGESMYNYLLDMINT